MKLSANLTMLFTEQPLLERIVSAAAAGFDGVEIQFPYEVPALRMKDELARAGMPLVLMNFPGGDFVSGGPGLAAVPARQEAFDEALQEALSYAAMVRPQLVNVLPGRLAKGLSREEAIATLIGNIRKAAEAFQILNIGVVSEAINPIDMPGFLVNTPQHLQGLLAAIDHDNFRAQLDIYHMARQGIDPVAAVEMLAGRIGHVQFADCPGRGAPGSANIDFVAVREALEKAAYRGWLGAEYRPEEGDTRASLGWMTAWRSVDQG
ncbi:hydroxypyruvate isomerase family protein [Phytopseudomonas punonensis]|uniref:Hydroxypyruvate isomerase n=1 Tax=Phytopseudomonas punonensis TaxID=1220495 RepID=A0A1M7CFX3_9GAMM|nr:TIM barrel protein [Pseudomonas punonensis]SHL66148.1 hydroxypyruvate isomerase [Pseudomonas punonensis]